MLPNTPLLARDEDAARVLGDVAAIALVHVGTLNRAAGEQFSGANQATEGMAIVRIAGQCGGVQDEHSAGGAGIGGADRALTPNS